MFVALNCYSHHIQSFSTFGNVKVQVDNFMVVVDISILSSIEEATFDELVVIHVFRKVIGHLANTEEFNQ